jgi:hypothetical protein
MKCSVRVKRINGIEYFYEDTPYYDREKKQIRHRSRYLGKNVDGEPRKVRSRLPRCTCNYGEVLPFLDILGELDIKRHMDLLDGTDRNMLVAIGINRACRPLPVQHLHYWYRSSYLSLACPAGDFSDKQLEGFLRRIGEGDLDSRFHARLLKGLGTERALVYEITALSGGPGSKDRSTFRPGGDGEKMLPGLGVSMIVDPARGVPFMYDIYPGIADAGTFQTTLHRLHAGGVNDCTLVLDQGFFTVSNIVELISSGRSFIVPANRRLKSVRELLSSVRREIDRPEYLHQYDGCPLFVKPIVLPVGDREIKGYCYYDPGRERTEQRHFYMRLNDTLEKLRKTKVPEWRDAEDVFKEKTGPMHKFFSLEKEGEGFRIEVRRNAVSQYVNRLGMFVLLCQGEADWQECLSVHMEKDIVEQAFRQLQGDAEASPLNVHKEETVRGLVFVGFLSLVLRTRLSRRVKETGLSKRYTVDSLLLELEGIKKIELEDGSFITTQLTRRQKEILRRLRLST